MVGKALNPDLFRCTVVSNMVKGKRSVLDDQHILPPHDKDTNSGRKAQTCSRYNRSQDGYDGVAVTCMRERS